MLQSLKIQNFALISKLTLDFENGFTVFTGETGSGKSILLGALNLILGERADFSVVRDSSEKTVVEAIFQVKNYQLEFFFEEHDLDFSEEVIIRREITNQGKSRAFINDSPVQLTVLKSFSERLIHIHSQHHTLELKNDLFQLDILDYLSDSIEMRQLFKDKYNEFKKLNREINLKKEELHKSRLEEDYINFQILELEKLTLDKINYTDLEVELEQMNHLEGIKESFQLIQAGILEDNQILDKLNIIKSNLEKTKHLHSDIEQYTERIKSVILELKDISSEAENSLESLSANPERKVEIEQLISNFNSNLLKHNSKSQDDLISILDTFQSKSSYTNELTSLLHDLEEKFDVLNKELMNLGEKLHQNRLNSKGEIENQLVAVLSELKMENSIVRFDFDKLEIPNETGFSKITLNFSPNLGVSPKAIDKVASGGELSRFMLAVQLLLSHKKQLPTLIFDEIDTGVSGEVAQKIGDLLKKMGNTIQLMAITHLPQVAAKSQAHFKVSKFDLDGKTQTSVEKLNLEEKTIEIARLMSGEKINDAAILNAKELMS
jgi:DNA repair protein RecN (Recombination protein N)